MMSLILALSILADQDRTDVHVHLHRPGRQTKEEVAEAAKDLVKKMDDLGIAHTLILPPPKPDDNRRGLPYRDLLEVIGNHPGRLYFVGGGDLLNPMIQKTGPDEVTPKVREEFERRAEEIVKAGAKGFGEMTALHLSLYDGHPFEEVSPDHPLFLLLADLAARYDVPIDLHMDAIAEDTDFPKNLGKIARLNPERLKGNVAAFEKLLSHNPKARIVWQHASSDPVCGMTVELLRRLLRDHANLFVAFRVPNAEWGTARGRRHPNALLDVEGDLRKDWLELVADFPDRFVMGSDFFAANTDHTGGTLSLEGAWSVVNKFPPDLAKKVGGENAVRIYKLP